MNLHTILIVKDSGIARHAYLSGVNRLMVDLEYMGKKERQKDLKTAHFGGASWESLTSVREAVPAAQIIVRLNPYGEHSASEVEKAIDLGADYLMLPMFHDADTVHRFLAIVGGKVPVIPLLETSGALSHISALSNLSGLDHIYIGFNDLHLSLNQRFLFEPLAYGVIDTLAGVCKHNHIAFGMGGIGKIMANNTDITLDPYLVLSEHVRLGSSWVILSQAFCGGVQTSLEELKIKVDLPREIQNLKQAYSQLTALPFSALESNKEKLRKTVFKIATEKAD